MFLSAGGYWPNKAFDELVGIFEDSHRDDATLVLTGYDNRFGLMPKNTRFIRPFILNAREHMLSALQDADLYILNSYSEGFGLVLLEAMLNRTPWVGRNIAGAELMREYGHTYQTPEELRTYLKLFRGVPQTNLLQAEHYVMTTHLIGNTVSDILRVGQ
jgi:glycosyltransferase involved in cell wall biosynthesis